jgi:arylsulfatase A
MKLWTTEAGFRVAGIMRWPSKIAAGQTVKHPVSSLDFFPTFCDLSGIEPPTDLQLDGTNFLPALENKPLQRKHPLLWVFYNAINERRVAMRDGDWKVMAKLNIGKYVTVTTDDEELVKSATLSDFQLFLMTDDIGESNDLSKNHPEKLEELKQRLEVQYRELVDDSHIWESKK